jgi:thiol reductant ABC exporter CydC subunit
MAAFMWMNDPRLAAVLVGFFMLAGIGLPLLVRFLSRRPGRDLVTERAELQAALVDGVQGMADVVAFGHERETAKAIDTLGRRLAATQRRLTWINGLRAGVTSLLTNGAMVAVVVIAIELVSAGRFRGIFLAALAMATLACFEAIHPLSAAAESLASIRAAARRLFELADSEPEVRDPVEPVRMAPQSYSISVSNLRFAYAPGDPPALDGVSFHLPEGGRLAIVGPSGAGKSTLANLLLRFWDFHEGQILLGGVDVRKYAQDDVRRVIGLISPHTYLFNATIRENLLIARPDATEEEMIRAARAAQLHEFVERLPQGYDTWIGERGVALSGGERQRIAIARALLRDVPILILDEPTANLDTVTEREVLRAIHAATAGRTILLITHRLVGLEAMDEIIVLEAGRVVERGTHAELIARPGLCQRLWLLQNRIVNTSGEPEVDQAWLRSRLETTIPSSSA